MCILIPHLYLKSIVAQNYYEVYNPFKILAGERGSEIGLNSPLIYAHKKGGGDNGKCLKSNSTDMSKERS